MVPEQQRYVTNCVAMAFTAQALSLAGQITAIRTDDPVLWRLATLGWARAAGIYWTLARMAATSG